MALHLRAWLAQGMLTMEEGAQLTWSGSFVLVCP